MQEWVIQAFFVNCFIEKNLTQWFVHVFYIYMVSYNFGLFFTQSYRMASRDLRVYFSHVDYF